MKKRLKTPFFGLPDYDPSSHRFTVNLLSANLFRVLVFQPYVLKAEIEHDDDDLLILDGYASNWMAHADHSAVPDLPMTVE